MSTDTTPPESPDPFYLQRFVAAQESGGTFAHALAELRNGYKASHWMWFVFPQLAGLGMSPMSQRYAIGSIAEARAYLENAVLGPRLLECSEVLLGLGDKTAEEVLGGIDAQKLRSSMTLFLRADPNQPVFARVLAQYFRGEADPATDRLL